MGNINKELERLQLISDFLKGRLSARQLENFKHKVETDPILKEEFYRYKQLFELLKKKQEQDINSIVDAKNDISYMKQERIHRRHQLRQELEKIKQEKTEKQKDWERKVAQANQPSIYKMAAVFLLAITIGASVFFVATHLIDSQNQKALQAEVIAPTLVEVETNPKDVLENERNTPLFDENKEVFVQNNKKETHPTKEENTSLKSENLIAYQPIEDLERKLTQNTRSTIALLSPLVEVENYTEGLVFEWRGEVEEEIYLELINFKREAKTYQNLESPFVLDEKLGKGIYYWVLQTDSEIIRRGKFVVK